MTKKGGRIGEATRAVIYARVSTSEQAVEGWSVDAQLRACRAEAERRGWTLVEEYVEEGRSARTDNPAKRPRFQAMLAAVDAHQLDVILVHKLDRFSRNLRVTLDTFERMAHASVAFVSITEQIDYATPSGRLFLTMLGGLGQWYSDALAQSTRMGKQERKAQGLYNGLLPFGLVRESDARGALPIPDRRPLDNGSTNWTGLELAFTLAADGHSDAEVARELNAQGYRTTGNRGANPFSKATVRRILMNRMYLGELPVLPNGRGGWQPGAHPAYLDVDLFARAEKARAENSTTQNTRAVGNGRQVHALTGLVSCWYCEQAGRKTTTMQTSRDGDGNKRLVCYSRNEGADCPQRSVGLSVVEDQVAEWLREITVDDAAMDRALAAQAERVRDVADPAAERQRLAGRLDRIKSLFGWGDLGEAEYLAEREEIRVRLAALEPAPVQRRNVEAVAALAGSAYAAWTAGRPAERHKIAVALIEKVVVRDGKAEAVTPRPILREMLPEWSGSSRSCGSDGDRSPTTVLSRYSVPHNTLPTERLRAIAATAAESSIAGTARRMGVARQTVRRAIRLYGDQKG